MITRPLIFSGQPVPFSLSLNIWEKKKVRKRAREREREIRKNLIWLDLTISQSVGRYNERLIPSLFQNYLYVQPGSVRDYIWICRFTGQIHYNDLFICDVVDVMARNLQCVINWLVRNVQFNHRTVQSYKKYQVFFMEI